MDPRQNIEVDFSSELSSIKADTIVLTDILFKGYLSLWIASLMTHPRTKASPQFVLVDTTPTNSAIFILRPEILECQLTISIESMISRPNLQASYEDKGPSSWKNN
ncbi:hypothetical protein RF11_13228 [Thelohanellus kitauei]|uniref:Uncharacterized protein n=1 Tax=Thelohanellus kitauei TaxID=669202 RepID=A0A0C2J7Z7_THEKT|nr:hypothetical protein RF11_13228 [Thelohanellus kitauei]